MNAISIKRLRNLTTGLLHTKMSDIYTDIEAFTGMDGIMTHQLPSAVAALQPHLRRVYRDQPVWDGEFKPDVSGEVPLYPISVKDISDYLSLFDKMSRQF